MKKFNKLSLIFLSVLVFSCADEFVDTEPQLNLPGEQQITNINTATDALNGLYGGLQSASIYSGDYIFLTGLFADEYRHSGSFPSFAEVGSNDPSINNIDVQQIWTAHYSAIFRANRIIELVPGLTNIDQSDRDIITGQALGIRAQLYFNLVRMYGGVPLVTKAPLSSSEIVSTDAPRETTQVIFTQINSDLNQAISLMNGFDQSTYAFNNSAAKTLKAHVLFEQGQYPQAKPFIEDVLNSGNFDLATSYASLFGDPANGTVANSTETIFAIKFTATDGNGMGFFFNNSRGGRFEVAPSSFLLSAFEPGDQRRGLIVPTGTNFQIEKYSRPGDGSDDTYVYRFADVVLLYAEVLARENNFIDASFVLNIVRQRARLSDVTLNASNFIDIIAHERFVELYAEGSSDRYNTTKRLGLLDNIIQLKPNAVFNPVRQNLFPIPQQEIERNPAISSADQNPGY